MAKAKNTKLITWFYTRKYLIRHIVSEGGLDASQIQDKSTKWLRDMLYKIRNAVDITAEVTALPAPKK